MNKLEKLKDLLLTGALLSENTFTIDDVDFILDSRDKDIFDSEWMRNYNLIRKNEKLDTPEVKKIVEFIREISYKVAYKASQSSELASYISDDFGLIAEALIIDYNDDWVNALANEYMEGRVPYNDLKPLKGELAK
ncbi:hypothetical protein [Clostridium sp. UBA6640]|uniref:hypothetical protein n=1 Tax=Clostridium sp. UBA6640 TaxID=1946370 RepID=UPI0025C20303|nr:hypothetical protein [Clostridium sp. UBA6640]